MKTNVALPGPREPLLGPTAQSLEFGLLSARTAAVLRRILAGAMVDEIDQSILATAAHVMATSADAVEVVNEGGRLTRDRRSLSFGAVAFAVQSAVPSESSADLPIFLRSLAENLTVLSEMPSTDIAEAALPLFSMLADLAMRRAGTVGEGAGSLV